MRLCHDLKRAGAASHVMVWTSYRYGCGGNLIASDQWRRYEEVRVPYEEAYKNPMRVWMRVGGDYGYCGGVQVAEQVHQVNELILFLNQERMYKSQVSTLNHPIKRIVHVLGVDQSQTHFCAKPDGIVLSHFNKGTKTRSLSNAKTANKFCIPRDVVLKHGDIYTQTEDIVPVVNMLVESSDSDDDVPITALLRGDEPVTMQDGGGGTEPSMQKASEGEEVAFDFGKSYGVCKGTITSFDGDFYQVTFDDGDCADWDADEY